MSIDRGRAVTPLDSRRPERRRFLQRAGAGFGIVALADLLNRDAARAAPGGPLAPRPTHFPARARGIIWLFMEGAPGSVDLFDPKPELDRNDGRRVPLDVLHGNNGQ